MNATPENPLPELSDERIARMEGAVFARIHRERGARVRRRRSWWIAGSAAAALIVVAAAIAPAVTNSLSPTSSSFSAESVALEPVRIAPGGAEMLNGENGIAGDAASSDAGAAKGRETITTASAQVRVDDVRAAADAVGAAADARGGYVESVSVGASTSTSYDMTQPSLPSPGVADGWITVRVPADQLQDAVRQLADVGEVVSSSVSAQDVTDQAIDLRARIAAAETSVARLTELMAQAQTTADLIAAESALQERQAALDSDRQQLAFLEGQVQLSSLSVQLTPDVPAVTADPAGFGDGVAAGWNGLVATLNGIVIAIGFLLPWIAVLAVAGAVVWLIVIGIRRLRRTPRQRSDSTQRSESTHPAAPVGSASSVSSDSPGDS